MKDVFLDLLNYLATQGRITQANMYQGEKISNIVIVKDGATFDFTITKNEGVKQ